MLVSRINIVHVTINEHAPIFAELIELLSECLAQLGIDVTLTRNQPCRDCLNLIVGHTIFLNDGQFDALRGSNQRYIVFQSEALRAREDLPRYDGYVQFSRGAAQVWDYGPLNLPFLRQQGIDNVFHIPIGYSKKLERVVHSGTKGIDVLFYGAMSERRAHLLRQIRTSGLRRARTHRECRAGGSQTHPHARSRPSSSGATAGLTLCRRLVAESMLMTVAKPKHPPAIVRVVVKTPAPCSSWPLPTYREMLFIK